LAGSAGALPRSPEEFLGFRPGDDRKLADWGQIVGYCRELAASSSRVVLDEVGRTTEGRPFLRLTISSAANLARLEALRQINLRLYDPRGLGEDEAERLIEQGRVVVSLQHAIHSTEVASSLTALLTAHRLATTEDPELLRVLDESVIVLLPSQNPDGTDLVADWYRRSLGTAYEGQPPPQLYQRYTGHDNNRDWYMFTQQESRLVLAQVYDHWRPQIVHDLHQMGPRGARIFVPPYLDPWEPNVDPALRAAAAALGSQVAAELVAVGRRGVVTHALFDAWTPARAYSVTHGGVRFLSETAGTRLASPLELGLEELEPGPGYDPRRASWNFPAPWTGGSWRLRDAVDYQLDASLALLRQAASQRRFWLRNFLAVNRRACTQREPWGFVIPARQADPWATRRLLQVLRLGGVELSRAPAAFAADGVAQAAGATIVQLAQPASAFAKTLLERQQYPDLRLTPGSLPVRPYDVTAHTLPLLLGVGVIPVSQPLTEGTLASVVENDPVPGRVVGRGAWLAMGHRTGELVALARLLREGTEVRWASEPFVAAGQRHPAGTLLVPGAARRPLEALARQLGFDALAVPSAPDSLRLRRPRVGLYQSWVPAMDEGWTRFVFEHELEVPYQTLHDADVQAGHLRARFDALVLADQPRAEIVAGATPDQLPIEMTGGLGPTGLAQLRAFVEAGGTLVLLNRACALASRDLGLPVTDRLQGVERDAFFAPGSILRVQLDLRQPLAHGLPESLPIWFEHGPAFDLEGTKAVAVARYTEPEPLLSGWLNGGRWLESQAALVQLELGRGRVVLFGFRPQYRAQSWVTYPLLANALYLSAASAAR